MAKISRFNPQRMSEEDVLALATGRENILKIMLEDMQACLEEEGNQHFIFYGPRGIGKSFFTRLLSISHNRSDDFKDSMFIMFPEEQSNINFVADILDMISTKLEGNNFTDLKNRWDISDTDWRQSKQRLQDNLDRLKKEKGIKHVFFTMENLQDFIPPLEPQENGRMREFLSDFEDITLIGSSLHPDVDNDSNKKLFHAFKKIDITPWKEDEYIAYYHKKAKQKGIDLNDNEKIKELEFKIKAIAKFTGGSPRLAVILNGLVIDDDILTTCEIMDGIIDELTPYYQDLTKDIPNRSKLLFDLLIRLGENITQSKLAANLSPAQEQKTIARSFKWLTDNFYVEFVKQKSANVKHYYVRDRLYVLYYQNREVMADQPYSFIETFVDFLTSFYREDELRKRLVGLDDKHSHSRILLMAYSKKMGRLLDKDLEIFQIKNAIENIGQEKGLARKLLNDGNFKECIELLERLSLSKRDSLDCATLGYCYAKLKDFTKAIEYNLMATELDSNNMVAYNNLAGAYVELDDYKNAIPNYKKAIKLDPLPGTYNNLGNSLNELKEYEKAIEMYKMSIQIDSHSLAYGNLARTYLKLKKYENAKLNYSKAIEFNQTDYQLYNGLATSYVLLDDFQNAEINYLKALDLEPDSVSVNNNLGNVYSVVLDYEKAKKYHRIALNLSPNNEVAITALVELNLREDSYNDIIPTIMSNQNFEKILSSALFSVLSHEKAKDFNKVKKVLSWLSDSQPQSTLQFISNLFTNLYKGNKKGLLQDVIEEVQLIKLNDKAISVNLQAWQYLLNPDEIELASLHPDARIAVQAVLEEK